MNIKKIRIWLKEWFNTPSISIKNVKDSNISIKVDGKEKVKQLLFICVVGIIVLMCANVQAMNSARLRTEIYK